MPTALITGVLGQDGSYLAELLREKGYRVVGVDLVTPATPFSGVEHVACDVRDASAITDLCSSVRPDEIYHFAGQTSVARSFEEPAATFHGLADGTLNVLEGARALTPSPRVLIAGSGEVFGNTQGERADETSAFHPLSPYGAAKAAACHLASTYRTSFGLFACVAQFYNHESPRRPERFVTRKIVRGACRIARGLEQKLELGDTSVIRDWGWAAEFVDAAWRMLARDEPEDFVIATGESCSLDHFVRRAFELVRIDPEAHVVRSAHLKRPAEIPAMLADPSRAESRLGWRARVRVDEVVERLVAAELAEIDRESRV